MWRKNYPQIIAHFLHLPNQIQNTVRTYMYYSKLFFEKNTSTEKLKKLISRNFAFQFNNGISFSFIDFTEKEKKLECTDGLN